MKERDLLLAITAHLTKTDEPSNTNTEYGPLSDGKGYKCIPREVQSVRESVDLLYTLIRAINYPVDPWNLKICDLGCGWGSGLLAFKRDFGDPYSRNLMGIEFRSEYKDFFKLLYPEGTFIEADLTTLTLSQMESWKVDVFYLFSPLANQKEEQILEAKVAKLNKIVIGPTFRNEFKNYKEFKPQCGPSVFIPNKYFRSKP